MEELGKKKKAYAFTVYDGAANRRENLNPIIVTLAYYGIRVDSCVLYDL